MSKETCETCHFCTMRDIVQPHKPPPYPQRRVCRFNPPTYHGAWPGVREEDWCSKYVPRKAMEE